MRTGFTAYCAYIYTKKLLFNPKCYTSGITTNTLKSKLLPRWNDTRSKGDGIFFQEVQERYPHYQSLVLMMSTYYIKDSDFYVRDILSDEFKLFKRNVFELKNIKEQYENDLFHVLSKCKDENIKPSDLFSSNTNNIPKIFTEKISFNSLIILQKVFSVVELNKDLEINTLQERSWDEIKLKIKGYVCVFDKYTNDHDWKNLTKKLLKKSHA